MPTHKQGGLHNWQLGCGQEYMCKAEGTVDTLGLFHETTAKLSLILYCLQRLPGPCHSQGSSWVHRGQDKPFLFPQAKSEVKISSSIFRAFCLSQFYFFPRSQ